MADLMKILGRGLRERACKECGLTEQTALTDRSCPRAAYFLLVALQEQVEQVVSEKDPAGEKPFTFTLQDDSEISFLGNEIETRFNPAKSILSMQVEACANTRIRYDSLPAQRETPFFEPATTYTNDEVIALLRLGESPPDPS